MMVRYAIFWGYKVEELSASGILYRDLIFIANGGKMSASGILYRELIFPMN